MSLRVDTPTLAGNGAALAGQGMRSLVLPAAAPAPDPISESISAALTVRAASLSAVIAHGDTVRAIGGQAVVTSTGILPGRRRQCRDHRVA